MSDGVAISRVSNADLASIKSALANIKVQGGRMNKDQMKVVDHSA